MPKTPKETSKQLQARAKAWRGFRAARLMTQRQLAEALGVSERSVQVVEGGEYTPGFALLGKFRALEKKFEREAV